ncbi:MAG TPA: hypothetical protein VN445_09475 [Rectinemataceae bacterium]|nr:hypothetical protein [Rectinemataceae bacterium]
MDYAPDNARSLKVLIVVSPSSKPSTATADELRFGRFAAILSSGGFKSLLTYPATMAQLSRSIEEFKPDLVFSAPDHLPESSSRSAAGILSAKSVNVHGWLESEGIPYVGSPPDVIELALSKTALKEKWMRDGISTPEFLSVDSVADLSALGRSAIPPFPCIVKPADAGNSRGITKDSVAFDMKGLAALVAGLSEDFGHILIERYLGLYPDFREITCACIGNGGDRLVMPVRIVLREPRKIHVITTADKEGQGTEALAVEDPFLRDAVKAFAGAAFSSAGVRDYSRCDTMFADGKFWAIEVNGQPMIPDPWFEACARQENLSERQYILAIFGAAASRLGLGRPGQDRDGGP